MVDAIVGILAGGGTGLIGSIVGRVAGYFERKQELEKMKVQNAHEKELLTLQRQENQLERESEERIVDNQAMTTRLAASYDHDSSYGTDSKLRWVRPILTGTLVGAAMVVYFTIADPETKEELALQIIYLASLATGWWFADRSGKRTK